MSAHGVHRPVSDRPARSVFRQLLWSMLAFGTAVGLIFPPFARIVLDSPRALSGGFFLMCILAGLVVGVVNFVIFRVVVSRDLRRVIDAMQAVLRNVASATATGEDCRGACNLEITSDDAIGEIETSFNAMTDAIARRLELETATRSLAAGLATSVELADVSQTILTVILDTCNAQAGLLYGDTGDSFDLMADMGVDRDLTPQRLSATQGPIRRTLDLGQMVTLSPEEGALEWISQSTPLGSFRPRRLLCIPLTTSQRVAGLVIVACVQGQMDEQRHVILDALRNQSAPYLQNAILHRKVTDLAALDDLTRILNRRFGLRRLQEEFSRAVRHGVPLSVIMLDIDHFKVINDSFGHDAGDVVLKALASTLEGHLRAGDIICRYGGEEFMIVTPGSGLKDAAATADRLRRIIQATVMPWGSSQLSITVSMGLATWPMARASVPEELITAADLALYAAKEGGRNRVHAVITDRPVSYEELMATGQSAGEAGASDATAGAVGG